MTDLEKKVINTALDNIREVNEYKVASEIIELLEKHLEESKIPLIHDSIRKIVAKHHAPLNSASQWLIVLLNEK